MTAYHLDLCVVAPSGRKLFGYVSIGISQECLNSPKGHALSLVSPRIRIVPSQKVVVKVQKQRHA